VVLVLRFLTTQCQGLGAGPLYIINNAGCSLDELNALNLYDLKQPLELLFGNDDDENVLTDSIKNSLFYNSDDFISLNDHNNVVMLSINVCSLMSKYASLAKYINTLLKEKVNVKIIAIQETWNVPYPELVNIKNFNLVSNQRKNSRGGGVAFYIKNDINYKIVNNLTLMQEKLFESLTVEANINGNKCLLSNIYRSPCDNNLNNNDHVSEFISILDNHLSNLTLSDMNTYVFTDSNVNLLKINHNVNIQLYLETIFSNGYSQVIGKATRIDGNSYSLIDQILVKTNDNIVKCGTLLTDISDHFMNFISIKKPVKSSVSQFIYRRNLSPENVNNFKESLSRLRWNNVLTCNEVNESFELFWNDFNLLYELHFPLKRIKFNVNYHKVKSYMTAGILTSRRKKLVLQKKVLVNPALYKNEYKIYRNLYNSVVRASKKMYIEDNFKKFEKNPKKTWDLLKETTFGVKSQQQNSEIQKDGKTLTDKNEIAKEFNDFFSKIGQKISDDVPIISKDPAD
jgi:hypothetical protein